MSRSEPFIKRVSFSTARDRLLILAAVLKWWTWERWEQLVEHRWAQRSCKNWTPYRRAAKACCSRESGPHFQNIWTGRDGLELVRPRWHGTRTRMRKMSTDIHGCGVALWTREVANACAMLRTFPLSVPKEAKVKLTVICKREREGKRQITSYTLCIW